MLTLNGLSGRTLMTVEQTLSRNARAFATGGRLAFLRMNLFTLNAAIALIAIILSGCLVLAQTSSQSGDPQAVALASKAIGVMTGGQVLQDVTLTGNVRWGPENNDVGTATLKAFGTGESRVDLGSSVGTRTEIRDASEGTPQGKWINPNGQSSIFAGQNTLTDAVWFFPVFSSLRGGSNIVLSYIGLETRNGEAVQHLRSCAYECSSAPYPARSLQQLSTMDFYLNAVTSLPVSVVFSQHPDTDSTVNIPVEVDYSNYESISGVETPMVIRKSINGTPLFEISLTSVVFNSGLTLSDFSVN